MEILKIDKKKYETNPGMLVSKIDSLMAEYGLARSMELNMVSGFIQAIYESEKHGGILVVYRTSSEAEAVFEIQDMGHTKQINTKNSNLSALLFSIGMESELFQKIKKDIENS